MIEYLKQKFPPPPFDLEVGYIDYFRSLYEGNHADIFPRAIELANSVKVTNVANRKHARRVYRYGKKQIENHVPHYVVVNFSAVIAEVPTRLINRALGNISADSESTDELEFVQLVTKKSKVNQKISAAVLQHQVDGGIAYRIRRNDGGTWFEFKPADLYFEHEDEQGADITWVEERDNEKYLRVERQRLEGKQLTIDQLVFLIKGEKVSEQLEITEYAQTYNLIIPDNQTFNNIDELMCGYTPNDETLLHPRGRSALRNIDTIQEEINWTITRDSIVFEKHGKPKLAIPKALWDNVAQKNKTVYGAPFVRNADLEVVSYNENNGAVPLYITWDAKIEESFKHVARLINYMLSVSETSAQAVGIEQDKGAKSAKAILYEWIQSVIKAEDVKEKFDTTIKDAIRKCILLENAIGGTSYNVKDPVIEWGDMLPKADVEMSEEESSKYEKGVQSLETTVRKLNPDWSEEAIQAEVDRIMEEKAANAMNPTFAQPPRVSLEDDE